MEIETQQNVHRNFFQQIQVRTILGDAKLNVAMLQACPIALFLSRYFFNQAITKIYTRCTEHHVAFVRLAKVWLVCHV